MAKVIILRILSWLLFGSIVLGGVAGVCQKMQASQPLLGAQATLDQSTHPTDQWRTKMEQDMAKKANAQRHVALKRDTDRLLKLSTELKAYVDKSNQNLLSLEVVKKADEIEKLAHSVKEKMKGY
jgi:hypothetical protein